MASGNWVRQASVRRPKQRWVACRPPHCSPVRSPVRRTSASAGSTSAAASSAAATPPPTATAASSPTAATEAPTSATTPTPTPSSSPTATTAAPTTSSSSLAPLGLADAASLTRSRRSADRLIVPVDDVQDAEEDWCAEGDTGAEGGTETDTEATTEAGTAEDVFPEGAPGGDDDDGVEYWSRDGLPEKLPIPTYPPRNRKRPDPSSQNRDSHPPSPRHKPNDHKRQAYTAAEKLKWVAQLDVAVSCGIETTWIINADQTPLWLEMPATTAVDQTGVRSVPIRSAGYQKERVTVMLACTADGMKLKPWVFFKRKSVPKGVFPPDVVVACHDNGWMDANGVIRWLEECVKPFLKPGFGRHARSSMVVLDSYRGHLTEGVKEKFRELNYVPAIIPSGCTAEIQPLDVCINKSFKASVRHQYQKWFQEEGQEQLTRAGNLKKPPPEVVVRWISRGWKAVPADLIKCAFLTCGISNALDGCEDGLAMAHRRSQLTAEMDVSDSIIADGFFGNNCQEPESDEE
ncbi:unnamed protein product [Closterium sp. NIES-54]